MRLTKYVHLIYWEYIKPYTKIPIFTLREGGYIRPITTCSFRMWLQEVAILYEGALGPHTYHIFISRHNYVRIST